MPVLLLESLVNFGRDIKMTEKVLVDSWKGKSMKASSYPINNLNICLTY